MREKSEINSLELLEESLRLMRDSGISIRSEWLNSGGGLCELRGVRIFFLDESLPLPDRLHAAVTVVHSLDINAEKMSPELKSEMNRIIMDKK